MDPNDRANMMSLSAILDSPPQWELVPAPSTPSPQSQQFSPHNNNSVPCELSAKNGDTPNQPPESPSHVRDLALSTKAEAQQSPPFYDGQQLGRYQTGPTQELTPPAKNGIVSSLHKRPLHSASLPPAPPKPRLGVRSTEGLPEPPQDDSFVLTSAVVGGEPENSDRYLDTSSEAADETPVPECISISESHPHQQPRRHAAMPASGIFKSARIGGAEKSPVHAHRLVRRASPGDTTENEESETEGRDTHGGSEDGNRYDVDTIHTPIEAEDTSFVSEPITPPRHASGWTPVNLRPQLVWDESESPKPAERPSKKAKNTGYQHLVWTAITDPIRREDASRNMTAGRKAKAQQQAEERAKEGKGKRKALPKVTKVVPEVREDSPGSIEVLQVVSPPR
ncbi:hypothetical protein BJ170DRAFT_682517 [Xylariales sp. AK1849]|nr:hypothetical protein BJ170DRAFT_682517 [Xylariales sp. AK1849]